MIAWTRPLDGLLGRLGTAPPLEPLKTGSRLALLSLLLFVLGSTSGCKTSATENQSESDIAHPGEEAAGIARARALNLQDEIRIFERTRDDLERRRASLLKDAAAYRDKAAAAWSDPGLADRERAPWARQYNALAEEREAEAQRCAALVGSHSCHIALLENRRQNQLHRADQFEKMVAPLPGAE